MILLPVRFLTRVPDFVFRKLLHIVAFSCITVMILTTRQWQPAALTSLILAAAIYPLLRALERHAWYEKLFVEKRPGEVRMSLWMLFGIYTLIITVVWGLFGRADIAAASILMWGVGDGVAALVGIPFGRHKIRLPLVDGKKSWEGTAANLLAAFLIGGAVFLLRGMPMTQVLKMCLPAAVLGACTEMVSPSEWDTVTVPLVIAAALLLLA